MGHSFVWVYTTTGWQEYIRIDAGDYDGSGFVNRANVKAICEAVPEYDPLEIEDLSREKIRIGLALRKEESPVYQDWLREVSGDDRGVEYRAEMQLSNLVASNQMPASNEAPYILPYSCIPDGFATVLEESGQDYGGHTVFVRTASDYGIDLAACLDRYPIIDDNIHSELEEEACEAAWDGEHNLKFRIELIKRYNARHPANPVSILAARRSWGSFTDELGWFREHLIY